MYLDLNVPWPAGDAMAQRNVGKVLIVLQHLGYQIVALNYVVRGKLKNAQVPFTDEVMEKLQRAAPKLRILKRVTFVLDDQNSSIPAGSSFGREFDIIAAEPHNEKALQSATSSLDIDLICFDMSSRWPFILKHKTACAGVSRGVRFEIVYGSAVNSSESRRQCIANASAIIRATRSRGIVASSGAKCPAGVRAPLDVANILNLWGLKSNNARESIGKTALEVATSGYLRYKSAKQAVLDEKSSPPSKRQKTENSASK